MSTQILKRIGAVAVVGVLAVLSVPAEAANIRAKVPFSFTVRQALLPAGDYTVTNNGNGALIIRGFRGGAVALGRGQSSNRDSNPKLVFHRYRDEYILREVWMTGTSGYALPESARERELSRASKASGAVATFERVEIPIL
jgi:hypothetical protein